MMLAEFLTVLSATFFASSYVLAKKGLDRVDPEPVMLISLCVNSIVLWSVYLLLPIDSSEKLSYFGSGSVVFFVFSGIFISLLARNLSFISMEKIGVSTSILILNANPIFSAVIATVFFGEVLTFQICSGMFLIFFGIAVMSRTEEKTVLRRKMMLYPLGAAVALAMGNILRKAGLSALNAPVFGAVINVTSALLFYSLFTILIRKSSIPSVDKRSFSFICGTGIFSSAGLLTSYYAFSLGEISVVAPIMGTEVLLSLLLSELFLRENEKVTWMIIVGALLVILGGGLILARG